MALIDTMAVQVPVVGRDRLITEPWLKMFRGSAILPISLTTEVSGTLPAANGGTGLASYAIGDLLYASGATALSKLADVATGNVLLSGGIGIAPAYGKADLAAHVTGLLPLANGGSNANLTPSPGGMVYSTVAALAILAGTATAGQPLLSGASAAPAWGGIIGSAYGGTGNGFTKFSGPTTSEKTFALPDASATILTSNAAVTVGQGGTGLGTLAVGRIPYGNGTSPLDSSADLIFASNALTLTNSFVVSASGAALPTFKMKDLDVATSDFSALTVTWAANTVFVGTSASGTDGGANFLGFTTTTAGALPLVFTGYAGSTAPTVGAILFRAAKWNGTTNAVRRSDTEICLSFRNWTDTDAITVVGRGSVGFGVVAPTARSHLAAGTTAASTAPLKFTTGTSLTAAEAGAVEFTTDDLFFTITTGAARKRILFADPVAGLTSGRVPFSSTNGRLTDDADLVFATDTLTATKMVGATSVKVGTAAGFISSDGSTGATGTGTGASTLTIKDGIITVIA